MKKFFSVLLGVCATVILSAASEQSVILQELSSASAYKRKSPRTYSFTQAQLKYGLGTVSYYPAWVDRPLFVDPALAGENYVWKRGELIVPADLDRRFEIMSGYGLDGPGVFYFNIPRENNRIFDGIAKRKNFKLLPIIPNLNVKRLSPELELLDKKTFIHTINGRKVLFVFNREINAEVWNKWKDRFCFIVRPSVPLDITKRFYSGQLTRKDLEKTKEIIRHALRNADGIIWSGTNGFTDHGYHRQAVEFIRDFLYPATRSVLAEDEFKDKIWGSRLAAGHENASGYGYYVARDGVSSMISIWQTALENNCDFIVQNEWDEQNENTSLRPTVCNSLAYMRIWRYFSSLARDIPNQPLPGDDDSIPPFGLSARKVLTYGERLQLQLLHVPTEKWDKDYEVEVRLVDENDKERFRSGRIKFSAGEFKLERIWLASENFSESRALIPQVKVFCGGNVRDFDDGFHFIELKPLYNNDFKFIHLFLRDKMENVEAEYSIALSGRELYTAKFKAKANDELACAELLEGTQCLYAHGATPPEARENDDFYAVQIQPYAVKYHTRTGKIKLKNAPPVKGFISYSLWSHPRPAFKNNEWHLTKFNAFPPYLVMMIPKKGSENCIIEIDYPDVSRREIPLAELLEKRTITVSGPDGFSLGFIRQMRQITHPGLLNSKNAEFSANFQPLSPNALFQFQLVGKNGKLWRSRPLVLNSSEKTALIRVWSETLLRTVPVLVDADRVEELNVIPSTEFGSIVPTGKARTSWGIRGGFTEQFLQHCGQDGTYGNLLCCWLNWPPQYIKQWPERVDDFAPALENGEWIFNGTGAHIQFSQEFLPRRANYRLDFEIKPDAVKGTKILFDATPYFWGGSKLWDLTMRDGVLILNVRGISFINSGLKLEEGRWSKVSLHVDWDGRATFTVNGRKNVVPFTGTPPYNICVMVIGGRYPDKYFKGKMRNIKLTVTD